MIRLKNLARRSIPIELPPELDPKQGVKQKVGTIDRSRKREEGKPDLALRTQHRTVGRTITLMARDTPGSKSEPLDDCWERIPLVQSLCRKGDLQVFRLVPEES